MQTLELDETKANLTFLNTHLNELNLRYLSAKSFTKDLYLKFNSDLSLNCIEPIVIKCTQDKMKDANEVLMERSNVINDLKIDTNNLLAI